MKNKFVWLLSGAMLVWAVQSQAVTVGLFNSGVDGSSSVLPGGSDDPHYSVVENGGLPAKVITSPAGTWLPNDSVSKWIWQFADGTPTFATRTFRTTFDLTGLDPSTAAISGRWATDNFGDDIVVNGTSTGQTSAGFTAWSAFSVSSSLLLPGLNTLDFVVRDEGVIAGFRVEISGTADPLSVPEGGSVAMIFGFACLLLAYAQRGSKRS